MQGCWLQDRRQHDQGQGELCASSTSLFDTDSICHLSNRKKSASFSTSSMTSPYDDCPPLILACSNLTLSLQPEEEAQIRKENVRANTTLDVACLLIRSSFPRNGLRTDKPKSLGLLFHDVHVSINANHTLVVQAVLHLQCLGLITAVWGFPKESIQRRMLGCKQGIKLLSDASSLWAQTRCH